MSRVLLLAFALMVAGLGVSAKAEDARKGDACCDECKACEKACLACADECLKETSKTDDRRACIKLCLDCADICGACARIAARNGPLEPTIAAACAQACEKCAAECQKHKDDKTCQACAAQCKKCAKECKARGNK
jgi:hypothetical protein